MTDQHKNDDAHTGIQDIVCKHIYNMMQEAEGSGKCQECFFDELLTRALMGTLEMYNMDKVRTAVRAAMALQEADATMKQALAAHDANSFMKKVLDNSDKS